MAEGGKNLYQCILAELDALTDAISVKNGDNKRVLDAFKVISSHCLSIQIMLDTGVGKLVSKLKKHPDPLVAKVVYLDIICMD